MIRITGGTWKGRAMRFLKGPTHRPTQAKVRQAMFNVLGHQVQGARVLDLFCGSGALGIEALSRGADSCLFVEQDRRAVELVRTNLEVLGCADHAELLCCESVAAIHRHQLPGGPFDLVFLDPPYGVRPSAWNRHGRRSDPNWPRKTLKALAGSGIVNPQLRVVVEHHRRDAVPAQEGRLILERQYRYGDTMVSIFGVRPQGV